MAEYIEREALLKCLSESTEPFNTGCVFREIKRQLAADVVPVVHGHWIKYAKYSFGTMYDCSICSNRILDNGHSWNYCPNCGAKMDEVDHETD